MIINEPVKLSDGVEGRFIQTDKFKTSRISLNMFLPLESETLTAYSLLSGLLTRASREYYNFTLLNTRLAELYGASLSGYITGIGDMLVLKFVIAVLDDKYTANGEKISADAAELLLSMIFDPPLENGLFKQEDFESERRILIENINAEINDKRRYSVNRALGIAFEGEPAGLPNYGTVEAANALTNEQVVLAWRNMLKNAYVSVDVIAASAPDSIFAKIADFYNKLERGAVRDNLTKRHHFSGTVKRVEERMEVTQCKLCMCFTLDYDKQLQSLAVAVVFCDLFGGGPYSRLFTIVREQQSLCYYCSSQLNKQKGAFIVASGISEENREKAQQGILQQIECIKKGDFDNLEAAKKSLIDAAKTMEDSPVSIDSWYSMMLYEDYTLQQYFDAINAVTKQEVIDIANTVKLDTVYFLGGEQI